MNKGFVYLAALSMMMVGCSSDKEQKEKSPESVETEIVKTSESFGNKKFVGEVEANEATSVSFTGMGTLLKVYVEEGQSVSKGQLIAQMDAAQCRNTLANCEAMMRQADDAYKRMKVLHDSNSISDMKWVEVESQVSQAKAQLNMAKKAVEDCNLYAPVSGIIGKKMLSSGETAMPSVTVCTILDINTVKVKISVPEKEIALIDADTKSSISVGATGETLSGGKIEKGVEADGITRTYTVRINVDNKAHSLLPGMVTDVTMLTDKALATDKPAISVPITAVKSHSDGGKYVWRVDNNIAHRVEVSVGKANGNRIEITKGLKGGEQIVTTGGWKLSEGSRVK